MTQSGYIVVGNKTTASGLAWNVEAPESQEVFASGSLGPNGQSNPIAVSGYETYSVVFFPIGTSEGNISVDNVTVEAEGDPTKVTLVVGIV